MQRIHKHPVLVFPIRKEINFSYNGKPLKGREGDTIASALHASGIKKLSESMRLKRPRGFYCAIGNCASCQMVVNGKANTKTCVTPLEEGMVVMTQHGKGRV